MSFLEGLVAAFGLHWHFAKLCLYARIWALLSIRNIAWAESRLLNAQSGNGMLCFGRRKSQKGVVMRLYSNFYPPFFAEKRGKRASIFFLLSFALQPEMFSLS